MNNKVNKFEHLIKYIEQIIILFNYSIHSILFEFEPNELDWFNIKEIPTINNELVEEIIENTLSQYCNWIGIISKIRDSGIYKISLEYLIEINSINYIRLNYSTDKTLRYRNNNNIYWAPAFTYVFNNFIIEIIETSICKKKNILIAITNPITFKTIIFKSILIRND